MENAIIARAKIADYLLNLDHDEGGGKPKFYLAFGFTRNEWLKLADALRTHAETYQVSWTEQTDFGMRYIIEGMVITPDGRNPDIRAIWFIDNEQDFPRLVSAYALEKKI